MRTGGYFLPVLNPSDERFGEMLVKMLVHVSGLRDGSPWPPVGGSVEMPDDEAASMCERHLAVPVYDPDSRVERAVVEPVLVESRAALVPDVTVSAKRARAKARR